MTDTTQSVPFRAPAAPASPAVPAQSKEGSTLSFRAGTKRDDTPVPPSLYQELEKKPYAVKFLDLDLYHSDDYYQYVQRQDSACHLPYSYYPKPNPAKYRPCRQQPHQNSVSHRQPLPVISQHFHSASYQPDQ